MTFERAANLARMGFGVRRPHWDGRPEALCLACEEGFTLVHDSGGDFYTWAEAREELPEDTQASDWEVVPVWDKALVALADRNPAYIHKAIGAT